MTQAMHLAEFNIARLLAPVGDPRVAEFVDNIERINGLGKRMPGFVWILESEDEGSAGNTGTRVTDDPQVISNLSLWEDAESLHAFAFGTVHKRFFERRAEWFEIVKPENFVLWWVPAGHRPSIDEALERLEERRANGDSDRAFGWAHVGLSASDAEVVA